RLLDPEQYSGQHVLVVGGGDSALEAATSIAEPGNTTVQLSYRSGAFGRAKKKNRVRVEDAVNNGSLQLLLSSNVKEITGEEVKIEAEGQIHSFKNDAVIICAGGVLPTVLLDALGVKFNTKHGSE
ncbi:MAG: NAD(P)-binding domain-containing protein, partial [Pseudomonadales bacterium]|nr:NAD(P)-binding domain-containing protein [Pseudomonadales bacterium]